jgi:D-alanine--poly(phosphoribitol) ligase subunit 1
MISLSNLLYKSLVAHPDSDAFIIEGRSYTYLQLVESAGSIQSALFHCNTATKSIGVIANQDFETYSILIAALLSGITYVPIEPTHPDERNNQIIRLSKINAIFCSDPSSLSPEFHSIIKDKLILTDKKAKSTTELKVEQTDNPAYILFTSGSTGLPKGVPISTQNLNAFIENVDNMNLDINEKSRFLQVFELTFDLSVFSYLVPLLYGSSVYILPKTPFKQMAAIQLIEEYNLTHVLTVPSFVSHIKPFFAKIKLTSVKNWLFCGEALKADLVSGWQKCIPNTSIHNVYGPTEATIFCTSYKCDVNNIKEYHGIVSIGKPFKDVLFGLFNGNTAVNETDTNAELCISGSQLTSGYFDDAEKNKTAFFIDHENLFYRSGDLCRIDSEGDYFFSGRNDTQVKINGYRVEISEIEFHAAQFPGITEAVVIVSTNVKNNQQVLNLVYASKDELINNEIVEFLSKKIPDYMLPGNIYFVKSIPYNLNGKIDKRELANQIATLN